MSVEFREKYTGELAHIKNPAIQPLADWLLDWARQHGGEVSANDVPRDLIERNNWRNAAGELLGNYAIGTALRRLEWLGLVEPVRRIPAGGENDSHRQVTVYRLTEPVRPPVSEPDNRALAESVAWLLCRLREWPAPPKGATVEFVAGWRAALRELNDSVLVSAIREQLRAVGVWADEEDK